MSDLKDMQDDNGIVYFIRPDLSMSDDLLCIVAYNNNTKTHIAQEIANKSLPDGIKGIRDILTFMKNILLREEK